MKIEKLEETVKYKLKGVEFELEQPLMTDIFTFTQGNEAVFEYVLSKIKSIKGATYTDGSPIEPNSSGTLPPALFMLISEVRDLYLEHVSEVFGIETPEAEEKKGGKGK